MSISSCLRPFSALFGLVLAAPLIAQAPARKDTTTISTVALPHARMDTTVMWVRLGSNQGSLRGKLPQLLKAEIAKAKALGLTPFLVVGATWCGPCQQLEASLHQKDFVDAFSGAYMIHLDMDEWDVKAELTPLGFKNEGIPIIAALDKNSKVISQLEDNEYTAKAIKQYLSANLWESAVHKPAVN